MRRRIVAVLALAAIAASPAAGTPEPTPKRGGTVVFGLDGDPGCLNPVTCGLRVFTEKVLTPAYALAPDLTSKPQLVSSVTVTKTPPFTLTYHIRPEARWSDRVPVTARDFVFTHEVIRKALATDPDNQIHVIHDRVRSIRALDAKTFRIVLRSREAGWRGLFVTVLPRHALVGEDFATVWRDGIVNPKTGQSIGSGPFLVDRWERGKQLTLVRNRNFWGPHVSYLDRLVVRFEQRTGGPTLLSQLLEGFRQGELDFAFVRDASIVPDLRRMSEIRFFHTPTAAWEFLDIRTRPGGHPALQKKLVRRALAYGIDRVAIVRSLFGAIDPKYPPSDNAIFLNASRYYQANWGGYRYRPAESRRLLERAGCRRGADDIYVCAGSRLELRLVTTSGQTLRERTVKLIQRQLRRAGIEARPEFAPGFPVLFPQILPSGDYDLATYLRFVAPDGSLKKNHLGCGASGNYGGYCQRLVTSDLDQSDRILDADRRARVLNRADRQLAKDVPVLPLYDVPFVLALRKTVRNVRVSPEHLFWNAEDWWLAE